MCNRIVLYLYEINIAESISRCKRSIICHMKMNSSFPNTHTVHVVRAEAEAAVKALDGRWFGGQMIKADLYDQDKFETSDLSH